MNQMEQVFGNEYFKLDRSLLCIYGLWPYQSPIDKFIRRIATVFFTSTALLLSIISVKYYCCENDASLCSENIVGTCYIGGFCVKYVFTILFESKMIKLYNCVASNWLNFIDNDEHSIMLEYVKRSRFIGLYYSAYLIVGIILFCNFSFVNPLLDLVIPLNESRSRYFIINVRSPVDPDKYYYYIIGIQYVMALMITCGVAAIDVVYNTNVHQILAVFTVVKHRLQNAIDLFEDENTSYSTIISAIKLHKSAIDLIKIINTSYNYCNFFLIVLTVLTFSVVIITLLENTSNKFMVFRITIFKIGLIFHMFFLNYLGQIVINHSDDLFFHIYTITRYDLPKRNIVLLRIMMFCCSKPCVLSAAKMLTFSYENFSKILKTTVSYMTVAISLKYDR